ncbi:FtsX-like permease family protein [Streptomyces meridianus]|uniref:FtsX-like permease family protein n=1 Tax=Streptomyces meridianus TaxID=2938945 RepID=A0ABT0XBX6_9ACTN|nr:FtsX-like permease family protein [Streptomyces meridianus]MCM2580018.1 FtsX-like permease family protein [Streptomyces meridianus]
MTGFVLLRVRAHRLLTTAALLTVVLTTCALAALGAFSGSVGDAGLRQTLRHRSADRTLFEVESAVTAGSRARQDTAVREVSTAAFDGLPVRIAASTRSGPYALPADTRRDRGTTGEPDLTLLATFDPARVTIVEGERPGPTPALGPVPVALPRTAARALDVRTGDRITLTDRLHGPPLRVRITGVYRPADRDDPYWGLDRLGGRGASFSGFTTYGPLLVTHDAFDSGRVAPRAMAWQARADFSALTADRIDDLRASLKRAARRIDGGATGNATQVTTELPGLLTEVRRSLLVSRSALLVGALQLAALAAFGLLLVARLLTGERAEETSVLRARGSSRARLAALTFTEALLIAVPAVVTAVLLAGPLVRLLAAHGALARAGVRFPAETDAAAWWVAAATALACALAMTAPQLRRPGTFVGEQAARIRRPALNAAIRAGGDLALLLLAGVAHWQLSRRAQGRGVLSADGAGALGVDPVLVAAPALCLVAGTVLTARLLPMVARIADRCAERSRALGPALAGWQLSRRPGRVAGAVLPLVLAAGMGTFALGQAASWDRSQHDQAAHSAGADIRVTGALVPQFGQGGVFARLPGAAEVAPVARSRVSLPQDRRATVLATDTVRAADVMSLRPDQAEGPLPALLHPLRPAARQEDGVLLPGEPGQLRITVRLETEGDRDGVPLESVSATVHDRYGVPYTFALDDVPADGAPHGLVLDFAKAAGPTGRPAAPLRLTEIGAAYPLPVTSQRQVLTITGLQVVGSGGTARTARPTGTADWAATVDVTDPDFQESPGKEFVEPRSKPLKPDNGRERLAVRYDTGADATGSAFTDHATGELTLRASGSAPRTLPVLVTDDFLRATGTKVGGVTVLDLPGADVPVRLTGAVQSLPTAPAGGGGAVLMDLRSVNRYLTANSSAGLQPGEWWIGTEPGAAARVAAALRALPDDVSLVSRRETERDLSADPFGAGPRTALPATALVGAALAVAAFAAVTAGALRERTGDLEVLRALGTPRGRILRAVLAEQGLLVLTAVTSGVALGALLTRLLVPLTVLTSAADRPVPDVLVVHPSATVLVTLVLVPLAVLPIGTALAVRSSGDAAVLRRGAV